MDCDGVHSAAFVYLDGELRDEERALLEDHLTHCPDCPRLLNLERTFRARYVEPLRPEPAPASVRANTLRLLETLSCVDPPGPWWRHRASLSRFSAVVLGLLLIMTGVAIGIGGGWLWRAENADRTMSSLLQLADMSVEQHLKLVRGRLPYDITSGEPRAVEQWFDERLDFKVRFPELAQQGLRFVGGRIVNLQGSDVAALHYLLDGHDVSLFVLPLSTYQPPDPEGASRFRVISRQGYDVIVWAAHGVTYSLVSEIGGRACMVCHQPGDRLDLPLSPHGSGRL